MIELDSNTREALLLLLRSREPVSLDSLAQRLRVSVRQVRYALRKAETWLQKQSVPLRSNAQGERWFDLEQQRRMLLIRQLEQCVGFSYVLSSAERVRFELIRLLTNDEPLLIKQLQGELGVSRTTVHRDLEEAAAWLAERGLTLSSRPHVGIHYAGTEMAYRTALVDLLTSIIGVDDLLTTFRTPGLYKPREAGTLLHSAALSYIHGLDLRLAASQVGEEAKRLGLADSELVDAFLYLAITTRRICRGRYITLPEEQVSCMREHWAFEITQGWCREIAAARSMSVPDDEAAALAARLAGARRARFSIEGDMGGESALRQDVAAVVDAIVQVASRRLHPFLRIDPLLARGLALHLSPALERIRFGLLLANPFTDEVRAMYPGVYAVARACSEAVESVIGVSLPPSEVTYLAMHLGAAIERLRARPGRRVLVICGEGIATAWLLVSRLRSVFPFVDVVDVMSVRELQDRNVHDLWIDMIVSTVELSSPHVPVTVVSPLLGPPDVAKVSAALDIEPSVESLALRVNGGENGPCLANLVQAVRLNCVATDWEHATRQASSLLVQQGIAEPRYTEAMVALIRRHGPYMVVAPGIALLHALPRDGALRLGMALIRLRTPVAFGHESNDPVDIVFAFACIDAHSHLRALSQLVNLLDDDRAVRALREASSAREISDLLFRASLFTL